METEKHNEATINRPTGDRPIDTPQLVIDIPKAVKKLMKEKAWKKNDRNSRTLFKSGNVTTVLVALHRKAEMQTQHPDDMLILKVLSGRINFKSAVRSEEVESDQVIFFHEGIPYSITAKRRSVLLLTVISKEEIRSLVR